MSAAAPIDERQSSLPGEGEILAGKYRVNRMLGEGGMGIVVAAHHLELDQPVAIKVLHENASNYADSSERFRREARVAAKIQSDHVTRILDVGQLPNGARYMVMEYLEGRDLGAELSQRGSFSFSAACRLMLEALDALERAHAVGIVHRDIKPENLFLARRPDGSLRLKVLDFGISKQMGEADELSLTKTSEWIGTPLYMSPEQMVSPRLADARSDIWSLGAVLYELISGRTPYEAESLPQLCSFLLTREPVDIRSHHPGIPHELAEIIMGCLQRDVSLRIQSAAALAQALAPFSKAITCSGNYSALIARSEAVSEAITTSQVRAVDEQSIAPSEGARLTRTSTNPFISQTLVSPLVESRSILKTVIPILSSVFFVVAAVFLLTRMFAGDPHAQSSAPVVATAPAIVSSPPATLSEPETEKKSVPAVQTPPSPANEPTAQEPGQLQSADIARPPTSLAAEPAREQLRSPPVSKSPSTPMVVEEFADFGGRR